MRARTTASTRLTKRATILDGSYTFSQTSVRCAPWGAGQSVSEIPIGDTIMEVEVIELGDIFVETTGVFSPASMECATQMTDSRDGD